MLNSSNEFRSGVVSLRVLVRGGLYGTKRRASHAETIPCVAPVVAKINLLVLEALSEIFERTKIPDEALVLSADLSTFSVFVATEARIFVAYSRIVFQFICYSHLGGKGAEYQEEGG